MSEDNLKNAIYTAIDNRSVLEFKFLLGLTKKYYIDLNMIVIYMVNNNIHRNMIYHVINLHKKYNWRLAIICVITNRYYYGGLLKRLVIASGLKMDSMLLLAINKNNTDLCNYSLKFHIKALRRLRQLAVALKRKEIVTMIDF